MCVCYKMVVRDSAPDGVGMFLIPLSSNKIYCSFVNRYFCVCIVVIGLIATASDSPSLIVCGGCP